ncbi:metallophosphoesterase [Sphingobacterium cavernae]|uniref:metallophosphoesterase n=1 Tax=Sphingobacterium cavernae TaxID=2592657 RepID=UPI00122FBEC9|nr:metallophosphoesterase [Sphingobacterium cavernae]
MRRRQFLKNTFASAIGTSIASSSLGKIASPNTITNIDSEDIDGRSNLTNEGLLNFVAIGDWGRNGADHQLQVAKQMGNWVTNNPNDFIISTGDNFYPSGVISEHDPLWHYSFENIYTDFALQWDWYPILGNHDYKSDPDAQVRYTKISRRWKMPARYYSKVFNLKEKGKVLIAFIDTNPLIPEFYKNSEYGPHVAGQQAEKQLEWLDKLLASQDQEVKWKIVVGHHPIYTVGPRTNNYDTLAVRKVLEAILHKNKVDAYLSGHDHSLQHIKVEQMHFHQFISGSGSEVTPVKSDLKISRFAAADYGFMYFSVDDKCLSAKIINHEGKKLYETTIHK